jgi:hypothetical protein
MLSENHVRRMAREYFDIRPGYPDDSDVNCGTEFAMKVLAESERLKGVVARRAQCLLDGHSLLLSNLSGGMIESNSVGMFWNGLRVGVPVKCRNCDAELVLRYTEAAE